MRGGGDYSHEEKGVHGTLKSKFQSSVPVPPFAPLFHPPPYLLSSVPLHPLLPFLRRSAAFCPSAELQPTKPLGSFLPLSPHAESPLRCSQPSACPPPRSQAAVTPPAAPLPSLPPQLCCRLPISLWATVSPLVQSFRCSSVLIVPYFPPTFRLALPSSFDSAPSCRLANILALSACAFYIQDNKMRAGGA
jgi:hypothetical protein